MLGQMVCVALVASEDCLFTFLLLATGSEAFLAVHTVTMLDDFDDVLVGKIET